MKTAMQDLKDDLLESIVSGEEALQEIEDYNTRNICVIMLKKVMKNVIKRIDEELLETEKKQIIDAYREGKNIGYENSENYYNERFQDNLNGYVKTTNRYPLG